MTRLGAVLDWIRLGRPHFLLSGMAFFTLGALLARDAGFPLSTPASLLGVSTVVAVQLGVHYANDFHDLAADRTNATRTWLAGGSHVLVDGRLRPSVALWTARACFAAAVLLLVAIGALHGNRPLVVGIAMLLFAWAYSAPPLRLHSRGVGEVAAALVVGAFVPGLALALAGAAMDANVAWALGPLVLQLFAAVVVLSLPDIEGDGAVGKYTLAVQLGRRVAGRVVQVAWITAGLVTLASIAAGRPPYIALAAGCGLAAAAAYPVLAGQRRWNTLAVCATGLAALQLAVTALPLLG